MPLDTEQFWPDAHPHAPMTVHWAPAGGAGHAHVLAVHVLPTGHVRPHAPQFFASVATFAQPSLIGALRSPLQSMKSELEHWRLHVPAMHDTVEFGALQSWPHVPQLALSVWRLVHAEGHSVVPVGQTHAPPTHIAPVLHAWPHAPQFFASFERLAHAVPHKVCPALAHAHVPFWHMAPAPHDLAQPPQLFASVIMFVHNAPQHAWFTMQLVLHEPQCDGSVCTFTHCVPHCIWPELHAWSGWHIFEIVSQTNASGQVESCAQGKGASEARSFAHATTTRLTASPRKTKNRRTRPAVRAFKAAAPRRRRHSARSRGRSRPRAHATS
jgi:hypothetical protein